MQVKQPLQEIVATKSWQLKDYTILKKINNNYFLLIFYYWSGKQFLKDIFVHRKIIYSFKNYFLFLTLWLKKKKRDKKISKQFLKNNWRTYNIRKIIHDHVRSGSCWPLYRKKNSVLKNFSNWSAWTKYFQVNKKKNPTA